MDRWWKVPVALQTLILLPVQNWARLSFKKYFCWIGIIGPANCSDELDKNDLENPCLMYSADCWAVIAVLCFFFCAGLCIDTLVLS